MGRSFNTDTKSKEPGRGGSGRRRPSCGAAEGEAGAGRSAPLWPEPRTGSALPQQSGPGLPAPHPRRRNSASERPTQRPPVPATPAPSGSSRSPLLAPERRRGPRAPRCPERPPQTQDRGAGTAAASPPRPPAHLSRPRPPGLSARPPGSRPRLPARPPRAGVGRGRAGRGGARLLPAGATWGAREGAGRARTGGPRLRAGAPGSGPCAGLKGGPAAARQGTAGAVSARGAAGGRPLPGWAALEVEHRACRPHLAERGEGKPTPFSARGRHGEPRPENRENCGEDTDDELVQNWKNSEWPFPTVPL